jgi:hypothetical protein
LAIKIFLTNSTFNQTLFLALVVAQKSDREQKKKKKKRKREAIYFETKTY